MGKPNLKPPVVVTETAPVDEKAIGGGLEGADRLGREMYSWRPAINSPDQQINIVKDIVDARGADAVQNDGFALGAVNIHRDNIVGSQFRLNAQPDWEVIGATEEWAEEFQKWVEPRFNLLADSDKCWFDASRTMTLTGMIRLAVGVFVMSGEVLGTVEWLRDNGRPFSTAIQFIASARLSNPDGLPDSPTLSRGVAKNMFGAPQGYYFRVAHPGEFFDVRQFEWRYVPVEKPWGRKQVIHIIEPLQVAQTRGVADMVAVLKKLRMTKRFSEVTLQNAVVNASYAAAVESDLPTDAVWQSMGAGAGGFQDMLGQYMSALSAYSGSADNIAVDGVKMPHLFPGTKLSLKPMGTPGGIGGEFESALLRHIAAALGLSYEQFSRDYSKTNYSSARASMAETWKYMQSRKKAVADRLATQIYTLWLEEEINSGRAPMPAGMGNEIFYDPVKREALLNCTWIGASRGQIDEMKETQSAILRIDSGLSTYEAECARLGEDFRRIFRQRARENRMMEEMKLSFNMQSTKPGANKAQQTMDKGDGGKKTTTDDEDDDL